MLLQMTTFRNQFFEPRATDCPRLRRSVDAAAMAPRPLGAWFLRHSTAAATLERPGMLRNVESDNRDSRFWRGRHLGNGHKAREHNDKMVGRQRLIRLRRSIFLNFWASDLHVADHRQCCRTAHSSGFADDGFAVACQPQAAVLATLARVDRKPITGPRACSAGFQAACRISLVK